MPIGSPPSEKPHGMLMAGSPVMFQGGMKPGEMRDAPTS